MRGAKIGAIYFIYVYKRKRGKGFKKGENRLLNKCEKRNISEKKNRCSIFKSRGVERKKRFDAIGSELRDATCPTKGTKGRSVSSGRESFL